MRMRMVGALSAAVLAVILAAGCGSNGGSYANAARPPAQITISVIVTRDHVALSPARVGAGPALLLIANESGRSHEVTLSAPAGTGRGCTDADASSGPINPQSTASVQLPLAQGECVVGVAGHALAPARLIVGAERATAQQDLLQP